MFMCVCAFGYKFAGWASQGICLLCAVQLCVCFFVSERVQTESLLKNMVITAILTRGHCVILVMEG